MLAGLAKLIGSVALLYFAWRGLENDLSHVVEWKRAYDKDKRLNGRGGPIINN